MKSLSSRIIGPVLLAASALMLPAATDFAHAQAAEAQNGRGKVVKGTGEGSYGWDLKPNSSMTNATVANAVTGVDSHSVTVSYHGKEKKIAIPDGTPVVTLAPATLKNLVPGASVFIPAMKDAKAGRRTQQVVVGTNGIVPPM